MPENTRSIESLSIQSREDSVIFSGIPVNKNKMLLDTLTRICKGLHYKLETQNINAYHWLPKSDSSKPPGFLILFYSRFLKRDFVILHS